MTRPAGVRGAGPDPAPSKHVGPAGTAAALAAVVALVLWLLVTRYGHPPYPVLAWSAIGYVLECVLFLGLHGVMSAWTSRGARTTDVSSSLSHRIWDALPLEHRDGLSAPSVVV